MTKSDGVPYRVIQLLRRHQLHVGLFGTVVLSLVLGLTTDTKALAAIAAGTATATVVVGFELLRQVEAQRHRRDEYGRVVDSLIGVAPPDLEGVIRCSVSMVDAITRLDDSTRDDVVEVLDALAGSRASNIPFFRSEASSALAAATADLKSLLSSLEPR